MTNAPTNVSRAVLAEKESGAVVLTIPGTDYKLRLETAGTIGNEPGKRILGVIRANARRIDVTDTGGRYIEPVYGRPRRIQGTIEAIDKETDDVSVRVHEQIVFVCKTNGLQHASDFTPGQFVTFEMEPGARFEGA